MGKHPNLGELDYLFEKGTDFRLSDSQIDCTKKKPGLLFQKKRAT